VLLFPLLVRSHPFVLLVGAVVAVAIVLGGWLTRRRSDESWLL